LVRCLYNERCYYTLEYVHGENPLSADQVEPPDGGAGPLLLGDVEVALAAQAEGLREKTGANGALG
jgi:hypothetical protein